MAPVDKVLVWRHIFAANRLQTGNAGHMKREKVWRMQHSGGFSFMQAMQAHKIGKKPFYRAQNVIEMIIDLPARAMELTWQ